MEAQSQAVRVETDAPKARKAMNRSLRSIRPA
jgi:hypothetical protein